MRAAGRRAVRAPCRGRSCSSWPASASASIARPGARPRVPAAAMPLRRRSGARRLGRRAPPPLHPTPPPPPPPRPGAGPAARRGGGGRRGGPPPGGGGGAAPPRPPLIDPNALSANGSVSLDRWAPARDGRYVAYALSRNNADDATLYVREVATGRDLAGDTIEGARYAYPSWTPDGKGFYYTWLPTDPPIPAADL